MTIVVGHYPVLAGPFVLELYIVSYYYLHISLTSTIWFKQPSRRHAYSGHGRHIINLIKYSIPPDWRSVNRVLARRS